MKVLHTADWHIGKKLHGYDLLPDQAYILDQILKIAKAEAVDAIMIAGDLYDRSVPSEDSVRLLNQTEAFNPIEMGDAQFYLLPYFEPVDARIYFEDPELRTIQAAMPKVIEKIKAGFDPAKKHILVSHFFVSGSSKTDSETKIEVGGLDGINGNLLTDFDYVALGHLHGKDALKMDNARYSGSPLKYSLSEKNQAKGVWILETDTGEFSFRELTPLHEIEELQASFAELLDPEFYATVDRENYLSILLEDRAVIPNLMNQLRQVYPRIIQVERANGFETAIETRLKTENIKEKSPIALTEDFFTEVSQDDLTALQKKWIEDGLHSILKKGGAS